MAVCALTMFDGMGDEVTAAGGVLLLVLALVLAWLSTHVADRGDHILGTILTVGAHASLIGLGGPDSYSGGPASTDTPEQQTPPPSQENKPEEEPGSELGEGTGEGAAGVATDHLLNIQSKQSHSGRYHLSDEEDEEEDEEEEEEGDDALNEVRMVPKLIPVLSNNSTTTSISVRLKFLNDTEEVAILKPHDTVGLLKSKYFSGRERQIKLIYQGQLLQDPRRTLLSLNITHNSVIHCHISQVHHEASPEEGDLSGAGSGVSAGVAGGIRAAGLALSTSNLVVPVFVVILAVVWYFRINYRQFFTAPATISLVGVTVFFSFLMFGMHNR
ncbi:transmembrane and ubiquitin-like domain-containing protein 2 [Lampris incognitus]|uniref:transmembrane and ubiquitin-like domain-containing protein 2 n=1 Tax=Lampris incognitus TaxID=2546036 RepID=UPI0024B4EF9A|nr:transmembrane and ubiquitin-like domain-containing protein 2 [Lampris incognitus]XP_056143652.1 transmembrane and ubiquitin-like domain-containing protein 2 [Lampris incognitus]XP_056143653.1 transmembrane and ubiquitin-like domain-containing protein 2 [Lampris incognitus]